MKTRLVMVAVALMALVMIGAVAKADQGIRLEPQKSITIGAAATTGTVTLTGITGRIHTIVMTVPSWTNAVNATLSFTNMYGDQVWADNVARARGASYVFHQMSVNLPIQGTTTCTVTLDGAPGGTGGTVLLSIYVEQ
jgi:hypothetical protein